MIITDKTVIQIIENAIKNENKESYLDKEELDRLFLFFSNPDPKKILSPEILGQRIINNMGAFYPFINIINAKKEWLMSFYEISGMKFFVPYKQKSGYAEFIVNFEKPLYVNNSQHTWRGYIFFNTIETYFKKGLSSLLEPEELSKLALNRIIGEELLNDDHRLYFSFNELRKKFIIKNVTEFYGSDEKELLFFFTKNFENNRINTREILRIVRKDLTFVSQLRYYQFSSKIILTKILPLIKKTWLISKHCLLKFLESQTSLNLEILLAVFKLFAHETEVIEEIKTSKKILKRFKNDPGVSLFLKL